MLQQLQQYGRTVQVELAQADSALERAAAGEAFRKRHRKRRTHYIAAAFLLAQLVVVALILSAALFHFPTTQTAAVICCGVFGVPLGLLLLMGRRGAASHAPIRAAAVSTLRVACSNCGAVAEMTPGTAAHRCPYCQTAIVASQVVIQHGVSAAAAAHRQAKLEELRESRRVAAAVSSFDGSNAPYFIAPLFVLVCLGGRFRLSAPLSVVKQSMSCRIFTYQWLQRWR